MKNGWAYALGGVLILAGMVAGLMRPASHRNPLGAQVLIESTPGPAIQATNNLPVVIGFKGDLEDGGVGRNDGTVVPFVIGDIISLQCEALNAIEYCWTADGEVLKDKDLEWSRKPDREWDVKSGGEHHFAVQVRGADPYKISQAREKTLKTEKLAIESFEASITNLEEDRSLTGGDFTMDVHMVDPLTADPDFYRFRYLVNDEKIKHPEDGEEWTTETSLTYTFPAPGKYTFKVEVRRATQSEAEVSATLPQTIMVGDAILSSFDAFPEKSAALGATVSLDAFNTSVFGKSECRYGVRKIDAADFDWISDEDGSVWGESHRDWHPAEQGTYILRAEVREPGKSQCDDFREMTYTITDAGF